MTQSAKISETHADSALVDGFAGHLKDLHRSQVTMEAYCSDVAKYLGYLEAVGLDLRMTELQTLLDYQKHLDGTEHEKPNSVRRAVIAIRQFYRFLKHQKVIQDSPFDFAIIPKRDDRLFEIDEEQIDAMIEDLAATATSFVETRLYVILQLTAGEGLKASEIIELRWSDFVVVDDEESTLAVRGTKARLIKLRVETKTALTKYRERYTDLIHKNAAYSKASNENHMIVAFQGREQATMLPKISRHGLKFLIYELGSHWQIKKLNCEHLRHYAISNLLLSGMQPAEVLQHLGLRRAGVVGQRARKNNRENPVLDVSSNQEKSL